jgi:predicted Zn-dependent peptidase
MVGMNTGLEGTRRLYDTSVFEVACLDNDIPVFLQRSPIQLDREGTLIALFNKVGAQLDPEDKVCVAHAFEHMPFRGTRSKPDKLFLMQPIRQYGGEYDGATGTMHTEYSIDIHADQFSLASETLYQLAFEPLLREEDFEIERNVFVKEFERKQAQPITQRSQHISETFWQGHPIGRSPVGHPHDIKRMTVDDIRSFHAEHYHAGNLILICGGAFSERKDAVEQLNALFGHLEWREPAPIIGDVTPILSRNESVVVTNSPCQQDWTIMVYPMSKKSRRQRSGLRFLSYILSDTLEDPLMMKLREEMGEVYEAGLCATTTLPQLDIFSFQCPIRRGCFESAYHAFYSVLENLETDYIVQRQRQAQYGRNGRFQHPVSAAHHAVGEIVDEGDLFTFWQEEELNDELTLKAVFEWRDYLMNTKPFRLQVHGTEHQT